MSKRKNLYINRNVNAQSYSGGALRSGGHGDSRLVSRFICSFILSKRGPYNTRSVIGLTRSVWVLVMTCLVGRNTQALGATLLEKSGFPRDVLAQKLVAELTVDPGEGQCTPGAVPRLWSECNLWFPCDILQNI